jgi:anaerobic glycerol-3-phosphate dehydrogenase
MENVYVIGSELGGADALCEGSGAGIAVMTGFKAAEMING